MISRCCMQAKKTGRTATAETEKQLQNRGQTTNLGVPVETLQLTFFEHTLQLRDNIRRAQL